MEFSYFSDKITINDQTKTLAEVDFPELEPGLVDINHTFVDD